MRNSYTINIDGIGPVLFEQSQRARRIIIYVNASRNIRVAVPTQTSFKKAEEFVFLKTGWIKNHLEKVNRQEKDRKNNQDNLYAINKVVAKKALINRLKRLAEKHGFTYNKVSVRSQRTRWGSCSHKNNISLNVKLVLLPVDLIEYVMLHELVHTRIHSHHKTFWAELDKYTGSGKRMAKRLRVSGLGLL